jgi:leucyl aminopeptidase
VGKPFPLTLFVVAWRQNQFDKQRMKLSIAKDLKSAKHTLYIYNLKQIGSLEGVDKSTVSYLKEKEAKANELIAVQHFNSYQFFLATNEESGVPADMEKIRMAGHSVCQTVNAAKGNTLHVVNSQSDASVLFAALEGVALSNYQFLKYRTDKKDRTNTLSSIAVIDGSLKIAQLNELSAVIKATSLARTLINEPVMFLSAQQFAVEMDKAGKEAGYKTTILGKKQIEALKMGGLLGVNRGSMDPPTFTVMEYKPKNARNKKPIVLVGKGVVFDTGGLSLKPTPGSMDEMKCDMAGGAAVAGAMYAIAANKLPVHVVGLVPATDNRPGMNAVVPQDILTISDGTTVEVLNTDAEGRLILADTLVYAKKFNPELCIDLATLTGAAMRAVGSYATAAMGTAPSEVMSKLEASAFATWERIVTFPMWDDYGQEMKSDIADLKNLGGANAGHISAGKFLEHFTNYPWIHLDIAGPAYINSQSGYRTKGGVGVGVRMLYHFIKNNYAS